MSSDHTETIRRQMVAEINAAPSLREELEAKYGQVWDTTQMQEDFQALGFMAPFIIVQRRSDNKKGTLTFQGSPRYYFDFQADS